jgi:hypothetical protein
MNFKTINLFKKIDTLHKASEKAADRNRYYLFATIFACIIICVGIYINLFSWDNHLNELERNDFALNNLHIKPNATINDSIAAQLNVDRKVKDIFTELWIGRHYINVPIFGFKFSVDDVNIIGSVALCTLITMFFFSNRREFWITHEIFETFLYVEKSFWKDESEETDAAKSETSNRAKFHDKLFVLEYIYHGCIQNYIFTTPTKDDFLPKSDKINIDDYKIARYETNLIGRGFMQVLYLLPVITLLIIFGTDIYSLFVHDHIFSLANVKSINNEIGCRFGFLILSIVYCWKQTQYNNYIFKASVNLQKHMYEAITRLQGSPEFA